MKKTGKLTEIFVQIFGLKNNNTAFVAALLFSVLSIVAIMEWAIPNLILFLKGDEINFAFYDVVSLICCFISWFFLYIIHKTKNNLLKTFSVSGVILICCICWFPIIDFLIKFLKLFVETFIGVLFEIIK